MDYLQSPGGGGSHGGIIILKMMQGDMDMLVTSTLDDYLIPTVLKYVYNLSYPIMHVKVSRGWSWVLMQTCWG